MSSSNNSHEEINGVRRSPNTGKLHYTPNVELSYKPIVGMVFSSLDEAFSFYAAYAKLGGFTARKSTQSEKHGVILLKYFVCAKEGQKVFHKIDTVNDGAGFAKKSKDRRRRPSKRTGCNAHIRLRLNSSKMYEVYWFIEEHNHPFVDVKDAHLLCANRKMTEVQEQLLVDFSNMNVGPVRGFNLMRVMYGGFEEVGATVVDFKNFKRDLNVFVGEFDAEMAVQCLMSKKKFSTDFSFEFFTGDQGALAGLFWADEDMKRNYYTFGDVVSFDATFHTNKYDMVFVPFTGIDNHFRNVTLAAALLASETTESYKWLLESFQKTFGVDPKVVVTDQDAAMKNAIEAVFPNTRHRLCMWHIMKKVANKVGPKLSQDKTFKRRLCDIVWTDSLEPAEFERLWNDVMIDFSLYGNKWLTDMFARRIDWIPAYYRDECMSGLMRTTSRSESENHFFGQLTNTNLTLLEFITHFDNAMEAQRFTHRKNDHDTRYTTPDMITNYELEDQADKIYTREIFYDVQGEIYYAVNECMSISYALIDGYAKYSIKELNVGVQRIYEVIFKESDMEIKCSCNRFEQYGLLCRHAFYVLRVSHVNVFPQKYIMRRWTRDVAPSKSIQSMVDRAVSGSNFGRVERIVREIKYSTEYILNQLVTDIDQLTIYSDQLKDIKSKLGVSPDCSEPKNKNEKFANYVGGNQPSSINVHVPHGIKNKGSRAHKRFKSLEELASSRSGKKRSCSKCGQSGHNVRNCSKLNDVGVGHLVLQI